MDIPTLIDLAFEKISPYLIKGGEGLVAGAAKDVWETLKKPFSKKKKPSAIELFEQNPDDISAQEAAKAQLIAFLEEHPALVSELEEYLTNETTTESLSPQQDKVSGTGNFILKNVSHNTINIDQKIG